MQILKGDLSNVKGIPPSGLVRRCSSRRRGASEDGREARRRSRGLVAQTRSGFHCFQKGRAGRTGDSLHQRYGIDRRSVKS